MGKWSSEDYVRWMYRSLLAREADEDGLRHFAGRLDRGDDLRLLVDAIVESEEFRSKAAVDAVDPLGLSARQRRPLVIVDVGARVLASEAHIYAPLTTGTLDWRCIGFEPQAHRLAERAAAEGDPRLHLIDAFIGDGAEGRFHTVSEDGSSSLLELNTAFNADFDDIGGMRVVSVETTRTTTLDDALAGEDHIDFLKFDIQGYEARALRGATEVLKRTNVIHCEVFFAPMYHGTAFFRDIDAMLSEAGFAFIDFSHLNRYEYVTVPAPTGQRERLIWGDAVFFRREPATDDDRMAQALIASLIYRKNGLAQAVLRKPG
ncbi:MAG: FkbM family methyltransferase [Rhodospirillales bacterium]|nr:FkbM family methyltransferase [Rhodospirillales bacterium]